MIAWKYWAFLLCAGNAWKRCADPTGGTVATSAGENSRGRSGIRTHEITDLQSVPQSAQDTTGQTVTNISKSAVPASLPVGLPVDPDLATIAAAWPTLPAALKAGILAMVKATVVD